jgi:ABC-type multidrug transport system permease subunit
MMAFERSPLAHITLAWIREFLREPEAMFWTFFFPILIALALGIAFRSSGADAVRIAVLDGVGADSLARALERGGEVEARIMPRDSAYRALRRGDVGVVVERGTEGFTFHYDPTRADARSARMAANDAVQRAGGRADRITVQDEHVEEKGSRYIDFLVPGLLGLNLLSTGLWWVGLSLTRLRKDRILKQLRATPLRRSSLLGGYFVGRLGFLSVELFILLAFARLAFDVPIRGSVFTLLTVAALGALASTGLGILVGSRARTIEAANGLMNLVGLPMWILSGVFFSADHFPAVMQPFIKALPLTALVDALRGVMLDGATLVAVQVPLGIIAVWAVVAFAAALVLFRWQ